MTLKSPSLFQSALNRDDFHSYQIELKEKITLKMHN